MSTGEIPFLDLVTVHRELREELRSVFETALDTAGFVGGPVVQEFERDFAEFCESRFCVGMASGTDALRLALIAAGVRPGDTVVTVPLTFIATTEAISQAGARPDFEIASVVAMKGRDRKSTRLNSSHGYISYAVFCLKKKKRHV